ncbi:MAG TPA: hypothetical protein VK817_17595 [Trebonia sp.]|nr:hypothetical protein [Trebonia sp.]
MLGVSGLHLVFHGLHPPLEHGPGLLADHISPRVGVGLRGRGRLRPLAGRLGRLVLLGCPVAFAGALIGCGRRFLVVLRAGVPGIPAAAAILGGFGSFPGRPVPVVALLLGLGRGHRPVVAVRPHALAGLSHAHANETVRHAVRAGACPPGGLAAGDTVFAIGLAVRGFDRRGHVGPPGTVLCVRCFQPRSAYRRT